jgi:GH15 family glucan-1,4-alpha-glucosidase
MSKPIEDYGLIGDMQSAALVARDGTIEWLCLPRFDSPAVFAALLGTAEHGFWRLGPAHPSEKSSSATRRRYRDDTLILESEWETATGTVRVIDFMPAWNRERTDTSAREGAPQVVRIVEGVSGRVAMSSVLRPSFDYGSVTPWSHRVADASSPEGRTVAVAGPDSVWFDCDHPTNLADKAIRVDVAVAAGDRVSFTISWQASHRDAPPRPDAERALEATTRLWREWVGRSTYDGPYRDAVVRSLIVLKALTYGPTGAIAAAATTSLPQEIGGGRNWDYRFAWLRDATVALSSLLRTGFRDEADAWRRWLLRAVAGDSANVQTMYTIAGERRLSETEAPWLPGYAGSLPVRIGNSAGDQFQLDIYGEVAALLHLAATAGLPRDDDVGVLLVNLMGSLQSRWQETDAGIWEARGPGQHFVHSKVMAWVAADRTVKLIESGAADGPLDKWKGLRDTVHREVCERGYDPVRNTFVRAYGSSDVDAALLLIPQVGFLPPEDLRVIGTIEAIQQALAVEDGLVLNYRTDGSDGLPAHGGAFLACSFWLAQDLALIGRMDEARRLFETLLTRRNDLGLLAEEWDPRIRRQVGNFPQGFSHATLVDAALQLAPHTARRQSG